MKLNYEEMLNRIKSLENQLAEKTFIINDLENIFTHLDFQVFRCQKDEDGGYIVTFNEGKIAQERGITTSKIKGENLQNIVGENLFQELKDHYQKAFEGNIVKYRGYSFKNHYYSTTLTPFKRDAKGNVLEILGNTRDITKLYQSELEHSRKTEFLDHIIQSNPYSIQILDDKGHHLSGNKAFFNLFLISPPPEWSILKDPFVHEKYGDQLLKVLEGEVVTVPPVWYNAHLIAPQFPDHAICIASVIFPIFLNNKLSNIIIMHEDITARVLAEEALVIAKDKAEESDRLKSAFLANMSHEIRTPMNSIIGFTQLLKDFEHSREEHISFIETIEKSSEHLLNLINDIIDISRIESGQMEIDIEPININQEIEFLYDFFTPQINGKDLNISIKTTLRDDMAMIATDQEKLHAIMVNLINNAIKFTSSGSIEFGYLPKGELFEFYVTDTGIGISEEKLETIFDRFVQADTRLSREYEGSGLGLSISKAYVEMLGGEISVSSEQGKGSSFRFTLPISPTENSKK